MAKAIVLLGVLGTSFSAIFVRWSTAPSLVLVLYRVTLAALIITVVALTKAREELKALHWKQVGLCIISGVFMGLHFAAYFESLHRTSISSSVVLVDTEVLFVALGSVLILRQKLHIRAWLAIALAFGGSVIIALSDTGTGGALVGDLIALSGAAFIAVYTMIGTVCRRTMSTTVYTFWVYWGAAISVLLITLCSGTPVMGYDTINIWLALAMTVLCTFMGHSIYNWGLKYLPPAFISTVKLLEPVLASILGLILFQERPEPSVLLGGLLIISGIVIYILETEKKSCA